MREYFLLTDKFEFINIEELEVIKSINDHGKASIKGLIHEKNKESYLQALMNEQWVKILVKDEEENMEVLFKGLVLKAELEDGDIETKLKLELITGTYLMDKEDHYRVLQKEDCEWKEILNEMGQYYSQYEYRINEDFEAIKGLRVQYKETDWMFLKRMAGEKGCCIIPDCYTGGIWYEIGVYEGIAANINETDFCVVENEGKRKYIVKTRNIYHLGEKVIFRNQIFYIYKMITKYQNAECIHEYHLSAKADMALKVHQNLSITGCSFSAIVKSVQKDMVQVKFLENEVTGDNGIGEIQTWFAYSTVYSTPAGAGWYCMPEPGDVVRIYFPSDREEDAYAISAVHLDNGKDRQNPENKSIKNIYGKEILLTPHSLVMTNNNGMTVKLEDGEGILIESNKDINIIAEGNMVLSSTKASIMIAGTESVAVNQGGARILLDKNILFNGSEFRIQ